MSKALYRKYRSSSLDTVIGQRHVTDVLKRAIEQNKVGHAYLLSGPRGVGKTSIARILAHEIIGAEYKGEELPLDIIEIDAASNNGVDDVRDLRDKVHVAPAKASHKVYIIDEAHMLSKAAFNALLKTLEEPPEHIVFILATTNPEKLPDTIISRTQQFRFRPITNSAVAEHLRTIATSENISIDDDALQLVAERGHGSFRDSISLLEQLSMIADSGTLVTRDIVEASLGIASDQLIDQLIAATRAHDISAIMTLLAASKDQGITPIILIDQLIDSVRDQLGTHPTMTALLTDLVDARESSRPDIKLLTTLVRPVASTQSVATPAATHKTMPVEVAPLPSISLPSLPKTKPALSKLPKAPDVVSTPEKTLDVAPKSPPKAAQPVGDRRAFDWDTLITHVQKHHVALYSVLSKCTPEVDGDTLRLYTGRKFNKTKLDDAKQRAILSSSLVEAGFGDYEIDTIPTAAPPKDPAAAAVAAIMGGGEQVDATI